MSQARILAAILPDLPAQASLECACQLEPDSASPRNRKYRLLRKLGAALAGRAATTFLKPQLAFSYSSQAAFCCASPDLRLGIDSELCQTTAETEAMRIFLMRAARHKIWNNPGIGSIIRAWTVLEAVGKLTGTGLGPALFCRDWSNLAARQGFTDSECGRISWLSIPLHGHWLSIAWHGQKLPRLSFELLPAARLARICDRSIL